MKQIIHELPLATLVEQPSVFLADPIVSLELAAITMTLLYLIKLTFVDKNTSLQGEVLAPKNSFTSELLQYVNVGNLISWPKRSLNNQRVLR